MSIPASRDQFKQYCLAKLGAPVNEINISDEQLDDRVDEAMSYWQDFAIDGTERQYYKYALQAEDITNGYITLPENIIGAVSIFDVGDIEGSNYMFNIRYQIALNDLYTLTSVSMVPYYMAFSHLNLLEQLLVGKKPVRYNRLTNRFYLDLDWSLWSPGMYVIVDSYQTLDPETYTAMWGDRMLQRLATAYIKKQWAQNLSKYSNVPLLGNVTLNASQMMSEAISESSEIEDKIISEYSMPAEMLIG